MADGILPPPESGVSDPVAPPGRTQVFGLGELGTRALYLPAGTAVVELFAVPELLARAVNDDALPAMRDDTALLAETFERRLREELRNGHIVARDHASRDAMPSAIAWAVLAKSAILTREHFCLFAGLCGVAVFDASSDEAQPDEARAAPEPANDAAAAAAAPSEPVQRQRLQETRILEVIRKLDLDPMALPPFEQGKKGVKAEVRVICEQDVKLFPPKQDDGRGGRTFPLAWERMKKRRDLKYRLDSGAIPQTEG